MNKTASLIIAAWLAISSAPAIAAPAQETNGVPVDYAAMTDEQLAALIREPEDHWIEEPCALGQPVMEELVRRNPDIEHWAKGFLFARTECRKENRDYRGAADDLATLEMEYGIRFLDDYGFFLAYQLDDADAVLARLDRMAREGGGKALAELETDSFWSLMRFLRRQGRGDDIGQFALDTYQAPAFAKLDVDIQGSIAYNAIKPAVAAGKLDLVAVLLSDVREPRSYVALLASRDYESAWPMIEAYVGDNMGNVTASYRQWALARLDTNSRDRDRFSNAAHALHFDGKFEEAIALARKWRERPSAFNRIEEGDGWAINIEAYALDALGRRKAADALFDQLATLDADEHPWVVNFVINRASRLVGQGRWQEGLDASALARQVSARHGSTFAKMLVAGDYTCALVNLGRSDEIEPEIAFLLKNKDDAPEYAAKALQCAGRDDEAAALLVAALEGEATRGRVTDDLQPMEFDLFYTMSILPATHDLLAEYPELQAAFEVYARQIPERFTPVAALRRAEIRKGK